MLLVHGGSDLQNLILSLTAAAPVVVPVVPGPRIAAVGPEACSAYLLGAYLSGAVQ